MTETIIVRAPRFNLYQTVTLYWNGKEIATTIVRRWFDADDREDGSWWYKVRETEQLYPESVLELR